MTSSIQTDSKTRSRRALLAGVLGGIGAWAASAVGRARPAHAGVDGDVVLGAANTTATTTRITVTSNMVGFWASNTGGGIGLRGDSTNYFGSFGESTSHHGMYGRSSAADRAGTIGHSTGDGTGILGRSESAGAPLPPSSRSKTGVHGYAAQDTDAVGVFGETTRGIGAVGLATGGSGASFGVFGRSNSTAGTGVAGRGAANRTGVIGFSGGGTFPASKTKTGVYGRAAQDTASKGVWGSSTAGHGIHGEASSGWAGYFDGRLFVKKYVEMVEVGTPSAPGSNHARLFIRDNGGKTQLCVRFHTGSVRVLATQA